MGGGKVADATKQSQESDGDTPAQGSRNPHEADSSNSEKHNERIIGISPCQLASSVSITIENIR